MYVVTSEEMRKLDEYTIQTIGIPALVLMENAGMQIAREVMDLSNRLDGSRKRKSPHWAILVGKGNNGGDGLVAARHLLEAGLDVTLILSEAPGQLTGEAKLQQEVAQRLGITTIVYGSSAIAWEDYDGIVDALLGTGAKGAPRGHYAALIAEANDSRLPILAVDIPSGLNADTGTVYTPCIRATRTVSLAFLKRGLAQYPGRELAGEVVVRSIGIWPSFARQFSIKTYWLDEDVIRQQFGFSLTTPRKANSHKGTYGHVLVCAGSKQMTGAGILCSRAAVRAGCGLATWVLPENLLPSLIGQVPEVMLSGLEGTSHGLHTVDQLIQQINQRDAAVIGPGLGRFQQDVEWLSAIWTGTNAPLVLDADALNMLAEADDATSWPHREAPVILTPHPGEMARLLGISTQEVQQNRIELAQEYAIRHRVILVLKGAGTVVATPEGTLYLNSTGNPGMATGGSGDVLAGMIASLLAQGLPAEQAASIGVWWHGHAGDLAAAKRPTAHSLLAGDIIEEL